MCPLGGFQGLLSRFRLKAGVGAPPRAGGRLDTSQASGLNPVLAFSVGLRAGSGSSLRGYKQDRIRPHMSHLPCPCPAPCLPCATVCSCSPQRVPVPLSASPSPRSPRRVPPHLGASRFPVPFSAVGRRGLLWTSALDSVCPVAKAHGSLHPRPHPGRGGHWGFYYLSSKDIFKND